MVGDMIVNLYQRDLWRERRKADIRKAFISDKERLLKFMQNEFPEEKGWQMEVERGIINDKVYLAIDDYGIIGFASYDCTGKGYFGPFGVSTKHRNKGIGTELLYACLDAMKNDGYGYAIIGWVADKRDDSNSPLEFYIKTANAVYIPNSEPCNTLYSRKVTIGLRR